MDDAHPVVAEAALGQGGVDLAAIADEVESRDLRIGLERPQGPLDHDSATVVAPHDIHCDSHNATGSGETRSTPGNPQVPAVTVMTWRPL